MSFHYLVKRGRRSDGQIGPVPFTTDDFDSIEAKLRDCLNLDLTSNSTKEQLAKKDIVQTTKVVRERDILHGLFLGTYTGHSFRNDVRGNIPANSLNQRPFVFLLYLSESGKIYVGSQYLGTYGQYGALRSTIVGCFPKKSDVQSVTFNGGAALLANARATAVEVTYFKPPKDERDRSKYGPRRMLALVKERDDDLFEDDVRTGILAYADQPTGKLQRLAKNLIKDNEIVAADDALIEGCDVIAKVNGKQTTIQLLEGKAFATKFPLEVQLDVSGHPVYTEAVEAGKQILRDVILTRTETND